LIDFTGTGGLFTRLGVLSGGVIDTNDYRSTTLDARMADIVGQYNTNERSSLDSAYTQRDSHRSSSSSWLSYLKALAQTTVIEQVNRDTPLNPKTLSNAITELIAQMDESGWYSIARPTTSVSVSAGSGNVGDGVAVCSVTDPDGTAMPYLYAETITATVTSDGQRGATENREPVSVVGEPAVTDVLDPNWPAGSGISLSMNVVDASQDGISRNGDFEDWGNPAVAPTDWTITTGTIASTVVRSTTSLTNNYSCSLVGNGSELTCLDQTLSLSDLDPSTAYAVSFWVKLSGIPAAGVLALQLVDGSNNVTTDAAGNANSVTKSLPAGSSSEFQAVTGHFRTPFVLPSVLKLRLKLTTALSNGTTAYVDRISMVEATQCYPGGPYLTIVSGGTPLRKDDKWTITVANNHTVANFSKSLDRLLDLRTSGFEIPDSGSPTISDGLIT
jgi:hypothetical protein